MLSKAVIIFILSLMATVFIYPYFISMMKNMKLHQEVSEYALEDFKKKQDTPTMGGVVFVVVPLISLLIISPKSYLQPKVLFIVIPFVINALIGYVDDYLILIKKDNAGLPAKLRLGIEILVGVGFFIAMRALGLDMSLRIPFTNKAIHSVILFFIVVVIMQAGVNNAVNLTDGMDGLAGGTVFFALIPFLYSAYIQGFDDVVFLILALLGSLLGYLFYNVKPARVFMGDVGSLPLGAFLASVAIVVKQELSLLIIGLIFISNVVSVILQVASVKIRGKRIFKYTPLHYSFKIDGYSEKTIVRGYWLLAFVLMILGIFAVKL